MTDLDWDLYRQNATAFAHEWAHERDEKGEAHSFWDAFLRIFQLERRHFARHESRVKRAGARQGFIDLLWPGKLLVEHKSAHKDKPADFDEARRQALEYVEGLPRHERPQVLVICNFKRFHVYDLAGSRPDAFVAVDTADLPRRIREFAFIPAFAGQIREAEEKANLDAVARIGTVHKALFAAGYRGRDLELLLVRILFCLFAEDTGIFGPKQFSQFILRDTLANGSDVGAALEELFAVLDTPVRRRPADTGPALRQFPYVNGGLFAEPLAQTPPSSHGLRHALEVCGLFDWAGISPEIFGSLFQEALDAPERRALGAHYTSERNIRRLIQPLFLDALRDKFEAARADRRRLETFRRRLAALRFLDPACGCGNFLVVAYRELRLLDLDVARTLQGDQLALDSGLLANVRLDQFHGIEIKPVSALIAQTALWLTEHQCNRLLEQEFGRTVPTIPLDDSARITAGNALQTDWQSLLPPGERFDFILGNPPFIGSKMMDDAQRDEIKTLFDDAPGAGTLDYVSGWYRKAARYMDAHPATRTAFVSTNSICQGEQVGALWGPLLDQHALHIHFAHQTFKWTNEAPGVAAVYCVIVAFGKEKPPRRTLFEYADIRGEPTATEVKNINPYLVEAANVVVRSRQKPLCDVPEIGIGNKPIDGGHYLFTTEERDVFLQKEPAAKPYFRRWIGSDEFINGWERWCLWLGAEKEEVLKTMPEVWARVEAVRQTRLASKSAPTQKLAATPTRFHVENMPKANFLLVPKVSSERRHYIPIGFMTPETLCSDLVFIIPDATLFHFAVLHSEMHMAWVRYVCGRLKSDYRYSKDIVYNNFPFPADASAEQKAAAEAAARAVLDVRRGFQNAGRTLAQLYDPDKMPAELLAAHRALDRAADACYGLSKPFASEAKRVAWLFGRYAALVNPV